mgnify:CR=1 FL=1
MPKRPSFSSALQKLDALRASHPVDERNQGPLQPSKSAAPDGVTDQRSPILEESLSATDPVSEEQCPGTPVSSLDTVQNGHGTESTQSNLDTHTASGLDTVKVEQCSTETDSAPDTVDPEPRQKRTVSRMDTVGAGRGQERSVRPAGAFTAVTHDLLRGEAKFREPLDFMVYMHLYTYSYGFGRQTADMSQSQLERFTAASKNTIKRSLERLVKDGWIKMVEDFECARICLLYTSDAADE